jgi:hypothetical protein
MLALLLLHGTDARMEWMYFLAAILIVVLPVSVFIYMAWRLFKTYLREKRETERRLDAPPPRL